ncbi:hypothetical protein CKA32_001459 [Geitlerinema sp. FC II]|nr:hypothetical protein [Geitlerinema sp. CS-897]PPT08028.1 hypothetical protein CKA32_001459 [Geitlerinema sp. FC II]
MPKRPTIELSNAVHEILNGRGYVFFPGVLSDRPRVSVLGNYTPRFVQPLENLRCQQPAVKPVGYDGGLKKPTS